MEASSIMFSGLGLVALFGGISVLMTKFVSFKNGQLDIIKKDHEQNIKETTEKIKETTAKQQELMKKVQQNEALSEEKKQKIDKIITDANQQIKETLGETDLNKINNEIQNDWSEL